MARNCWNVISSSCMFELEQEYHVCHYKLQPCMHVLYQPTKPVIFSLMLMETQNYINGVNDILTLGHCLYGPLHCHHISKTPQCKSLWMSISIWPNDENPTWTRAASPLSSLSIKIIRITLELCTGPNFEFQLKYQTQCQQ